MPGRKLSKLPSWVIPGVISTVALTTVGLLIAFPPDWGWLGVGESHEVSQVTTETIDPQSQQKTVSTTKYEQAKNLWDWLSLLGVPLSLALLAWWLQQREKGIAEENQREEVLQVYFDHISTLLIDRNVLAISTRVKNATGLAKLGDFNEQNELLEAAAYVIRARTLSILRRLKNDPVRKGSALLFLGEAEVIDKLNVNLGGADLEGAHLSYVNLEFAYLEGASFKGAYLKDASFEGAKLFGVNLEGAYLEDAYLMNAKLDGANLKRANLKDSHLDGASLKGANLEDANLESTNLKDANLKNVKNMSLEQIKRAKNWEKAHYDQDFRKELGLPPEK